MAKKIVSWFQRILAHKVNTSKTNYVSRPKLIGSSKQCAMQLERNAIAMRFGDIASRKVLTS